MLLMMAVIIPVTAGDAGAQNRSARCPGSYNAATWTNCFGETTRPSGIKFAAEFRGGKPMQGTATFPNGDKYVGEFSDGTQHGKGTMTWANNLKYSGDWRNGEMHGNGTWTGLDGQKYVGEFKNNKWHGRGTEYRADGSIVRSGTWRDGGFVSSR
jgi:hypothetical protein